MQSVARRHMSASATDFEFFLPPRRQKLCEAFSALWGFSTASAAGRIYTPRLLFIVLYENHFRLKQALRTAAPVAQVQRHD
jgi:hypothetical protein